MPTETGMVVKSGMYLTAANNYPTCIQNENINSISDLLDVLIKPVKTDLF